MYERTKNIAGHRFGKLTAIMQSGKSGKNTVWRCLCDCGAEVKVRGNNLTAKVRPVISCGCARKAVK